MGARRHLRPEAGFSLIELLVVMLILGIPAALGLGRDLVAFAATSDTRALFALVHGTDDREMSRVCFVPANAYPTGACRRGGPFAAMGFGTW